MLVRPHSRRSSNGPGRRVIGRGEPETVYPSQSIASACPTTHHGLPAPSLGVCAFLRYRVYNPFLLFRLLLLFGLPHLTSLPTATTLTPCTPTPPRFFFRPVFHPPSCRNEPNRRIYLSSRPSLTCTVTSNNCNGFVG